MFSENLTIKKFEIWKDYEVNQAKIGHPFGTAPKG